MTLGADTEARASGTKVDNGDGTYHLALPSGASTADIVGTVFTWEYVGQANFEWTPTPAGQLSLTDDAPDIGDDPGAGMDRIAGTVMVDELGRQWVAKDVDFVELNYEIADYWSDVDSNYGLDPDPSGSAPTQDLDALDTSTGDVRFTTWSFRDCDTNPATDELAIHNSDDRIEFASDSSNNNDRRKALVSVGACSGVRIASNIVLTAAHCVTNPSTGVSVNTGTVTVCSHTGTSPDCTSVSRIIVPGEWPGAIVASNTDLQYDYALLRVPNHPDTLTDPQMVFSTDTKDDMKKRQPLRVGFDLFKGDGSGGCQGLAQARNAMEHPAQDVRGTRRGMIRLRGDVAVGGSGGPIFFESGGVGRVLAVQSHFRNGTGSGYSGGPRVTEFRNWAIGIYGNR